MPHNQEDYERLVSFLDWLIDQVGEDERHPLASLMEVVGVYQYRSKQLRSVKLDGLRYEIAWVGDSRAYLWNGALHQLTTDHSYVQLLLNAGLISESEIQGHPSRNVITQALGVGGPDKANIKVDLVSGELDESDTLLLCSDGLSGEVADDSIANILSETTDAQTRVDRLITAALEAGGKDNVTVIIINSAVI